MKWRTLHSSTFSRIAQHLPKLTITLKCYAVIALSIFNIGCGATEQSQTQGRSMLLMGHSFFRPVAEAMPAHTEQAGIIGHSQQVVFSGGLTGAPEALWLHPRKRNEIQDILDTGDIEVFGMTYHPDFPNTTGYINWIEYALEQNDRTNVFVAFAWPRFPGEVDGETYENNWYQAEEEVIQPLIDELRAKFPNTNIYCLPYGSAAVELRNLFEAGELPEINHLINPNRNQSLFRDNLGHGGNALIRLSQLIWLGSLYNVDLSTYDYGPDTETDFNALAADIVESNTLDCAQRPSLQIPANLTTLPFPVPFEE